MTWFPTVVDGRAQVDLELQHLVLPNPTGSAYTNDGIAALPLVRLDVHGERTLTLAPADRPWRLDITSSRDLPVCEGDQAGVGTAGGY